MSVDDIAHGANNFARRLLGQIGDRPHNLFDHRRRHIANELPGLAPRHNDDRKITRLLCEAAKLEAELPSLPISIPITALHRVGQARADRLALLADDLRAVRRQRDYWRSIGVRSTDKEWVKLDGREADITSEIELIGGGASAPAGTAKA